MKKVEGSKLSVGQRVYIIQENLTIQEKEVLAVVVQENDFRYKLDEYSCGGQERKEIFVKKSEAEVVVKDFLDALKFRIGDLVIFRDTTWNNNMIQIGIVRSLNFSKNPYKIGTTYKSYYDINDNSIILKVKNEFIENFGDLEKLYSDFEEKDKELVKIRNKINQEYDKLEEELKHSFKKRFGWSFIRKKPKFEDRFTNDND